MAPFFIAELMQYMSASPHEDTMYSDVMSSYAMTLGFALYICKDTISGRSLAKRITRMQVVNYKTREVAHPLRCMVRGIFCVLWPIEIIVTIFSPQRRIGDFVAGTMIVPYVTSAKKVKPLYGQAFIALLIVFLPLLGLAWWVENYVRPINYSSYEVESFNSVVSEELEVLYREKMVTYCVDSTSVRAYDRAAGADVPYISVILIMGEGCNDYGSFTNYRDEQAKNIVYERYQKGKVKGKITIVAKSPASVSHHTLYLD